ncbi:MAG: hypothetical protein QOJ34_268 [Pseudonocardiales bacterium]|nr:hypothetical protein [Pseudonocardiales bacterium]
MFTDIVGSTELASELGDVHWKQVLATHHGVVRKALKRYSGREIDTAGDGFFATFARPADAIRCAIDIVDQLRDIGIHIRVGIHMGEVEQIGAKVGGIAVHIGARVAGRAGDSQILVSSTVRDLVSGSDIRFVGEGDHELKGVPGQWRLFRVEHGLKADPPARPLVEAPRAKAARRRTVPALAVAVVGAAVLGAGAVVTVVAVSHGDRNGAQITITPNSVAAFDSAGSVTRTVQVGIRPIAMTAAAGSLWVANLDDRTVSRIDLASGLVVRSIATQDAPTSLTAAGHHIWVSDRNGEILQIDPAYNTATTVREVKSLSGTVVGATWPLVAAFGSVWVVHPDGYVIRIDGERGQPRGSVDVGNDPSGIAAGAGSVWVTNSADGTVTRIDPSTLLATTIPVGHDPTALDVTSTGVWVANAGSNEVVLLDPDTNTIVRTARVGDGPTAVLALNDSVWVSNGRGGTITRLDARSAEVMSTVRVGGTPTALTFAGGQVWAAIAPPAPGAPPSGGVLRLTLPDDLPTLDPAVLALFEPKIAYAMCANLVTYPDKPAPEGSLIVPEVAQAVPAPTDGGRTYTFRIRSGFRFSPPSNEPVTAQTFKSTIERVLSPRLHSEHADQFRNVVGYDAYTAGRATDLRGLVVDGDTLTIRLKRPDGALLAHLAGGAACAVPSRTPVVSGGLNSIPMAGPYYVASYTPRQQLVLRRNPNYHGERPHRPRQIVITIGIDSSRALSDIKAGRADYALDGLPGDAQPDLLAHYGAGSPAAKAGHQQYFITPANGMRWLQMNTSRPLFSDVHLRRAVNFAIDRTALVAQGRQFAETNPFNAGEPIDDYMPPSVAGAPDLHLYPISGPDLQRAKQLAGPIHATAVMYTPNMPPWLQEAEIVRADLKPLGIDVQVKQFPLQTFFARIGRRDEPFDLAVSGWGNGSTDPADILDLFDGASIHASDNLNFSYLDNPEFNRKLHAAAELSGSRRYRTYARLELELERDLAPVAAFASNANRDFFSARVGCQLDQPVYGMDLGALCLRD